MAELRKGYGAFNAACASLYADDLLRLADDEKPPFTFDDKIIDDIAGMIYKDGKFDISQIKDPRARAMMEETARIINHGIETHIPHEVPQELVTALEDNGFIFYGFKTFHAMREIGLSLVDDKGHVKDFDTFTKDVKKINEKYNVNYLYAEYKHAVGTSMMAVKWQGLAERPERYYLQYRTAGDSKVRETHRALDGITLPATDKFWDQYYPPNGWGCRCDVDKVSRDKYDMSNSEQAIARGNEATEDIKQHMFRYNAGKTMKLFPDKHPYYKAPEKAKKAIKEVAEQHNDGERINLIIKELPDTLTEEEKLSVAIHCLKLETAFGHKKGPAMDYDKANNGKENPNYTKGGGYLVNCQTCTVTHWLRRLGFDITAKPNVADSAYKEMDKNGVSWLQRFTNLDGSDVDYDFSGIWQIRKGYKTMTKKRLFEYFKEKFDHDGVYEIYCRWKRGNAHVFCAEVTNGKARLFDPQSGSYNVKGYIDRMRPAHVGVIRIDNKLVNEKLKNLFLWE